MNYKVTLFACSLFLSFPCATLAIDFDGDGLDDPIAYESQNDGSPNELAYTYLPSGSGLVERREFGKSKEFPALADYDGDGLADLAVVGPNYDSNTAGDLVWRIKLSSQDEEESSEVFGAVADTIVTGCRFDEDAKAVLAFVRSGVLHVRKSSDSSEITLDLGDAGFTRFTCGDLNGDSTDEFIAQGEILHGGVTKKSYFLAWKVLTAENVLDIEYGSSVAAIFAVDVDGDGSKEIVYQRNKSGYGRKIIVRLGEQVLTYTLPKFKAASFGKFTLGSNAEGLLLKINADDQFRRYRTFADIGGPESIELEDTVTVLPNVNVADVGPAYSQESGCDVLDESSDGPNGFLYKPVSETQKTVVILTQRSNRFRNMVAIKDGVVLEKIRRVTHGPGTRDFFRSKRLYSFFPKYMTLKMKGKDGLQHCILIADPSLRYD